MKKVIGVLGVIFLVVVYCFTISKNSSNSSSTTSKNLDTNTISLVSDNLIDHSSQAESTIEISFSPIPNFKNPFSEFNAIIASTTHLLNTQFIRYTFSSRNFTIQFRNVNIIFPFHYFW